jgi:hypothetical protein
MFETEARGTTWTRTTTGRGKRTEIINVGCYVIEHIATGKVITGNGMSINLEIDKIIGDLDSGKHSNKKFRKPCELDSDLKMYEYPCKTLKQAKKLETEIRLNVNPSYLLVN